MMVLKVILFDFVVYFEIEEDIFYYFEVVMEGNDFKYIVSVLGDVVCFKGMSVIVCKVGLGW